MGKRERAERPERGRVCCLPLFVYPFAVSHLVFWICLGFDELVLGISGHAGFGVGRQGRGVYNPPAEAKQDDEG